MSARSLESCRLCGERRFDDVLDLGSTPLANAFVAREALGAPEALYPLRVIHCGGCGLVCLSVAVDPVELFGGYPYVSGTSDTMRRHFGDSAAEIARRFLERGDLAVDIGSNDGTLLAAFPRDFRVLGVEPAENIARIARERGVPTENAFFSAALAREISGREGPAGVVLANNVVPHIDDLADLMTGVGALLAPDGVLVCELPSLLELIHRNAFDTIYHEHLSYFSLTTLTRLAERHGLSVFDAQSLDVHCGSLRVSMDRGRRPRGPRVEELLARERAARLDDPVTYSAFAARVDETRRTFRALLEAELARGLRCAGYGAAAKGNMLLCAASVGPGLLSFIADKNPLKQGRFTPGTHIEVSPPSRIESERPDVLVILAWNFATEIRRQQRSHLERGGRFMIPIPQPRLTGAGTEAADAVTRPAPAGPEGSRRLVSIVCPVYNEEEAVELFYGRLTRALDPFRHEYDFEIIFTNNCSSDRTADKILRLREQDPAVQLLTYSRNFGQQASVMGGLRQAAGDAVIMIDVDCEDPPELIPEFLAGWKEGYDVVYGERNRRPEPIAITWMRKIFYRLTKLVADDDIVLDMAEFCLIDAQVRDAAAAGDDTHPFVRAEIARCGFRRKGIRYDRQNRVVGKSHYNLWRMSQFAVAGILSSTTAPLHAPIVLLPPLVLANVVLLALRIAHLWRWGFPALVCLDLLYLCASVAGIGLYLARNYHSLIARPVVVVDWRHSALNTSPEQSPNALHRQGPPRDGA